MAGAATTRLPDLAAAAGADRTRGRMVLVLALAALVLGALAIEPPVGGFAHDQPFTMPPLFLGAVLGLAAFAGRVAAGVAPAGDERRLLLLVALALAALAGLAAVGAPERLESRSSAAGAAATVVLALVVAGGGLALRRMPLAAAGGVLVLAGLTGFLAPPAGGVAGWLIAAAGGIAALLALVDAVRARHAAQTSFGAAARATAASADLRVAGGLALAGIAALTFFGALVDADVISVGTFDLNAEQTVGAAYSSLLLFLAALAAVLVADEDASGRRTWLALGVVFGALAVDELIVFHEELQERTDVKGQLFLAPLAIAGAIAWWQAVRRLGSDTAAARLLIGGAACWALSQAFDVLQDPEAGERMWTVVPEEAAEMVGSTLFALGLIAALRRLRRRS